MKLRTLLLVVAVLAALSAAAFFFNRPPASAPADPRVGQPLVAPAVLEKAARLKLTDQGKTVELSRLSNGTWEDDSYFGLPADFSKLSSFISDLSSAKIDRLVTANPERIARLEFAGTRIDLSESSGQPLWSVSLGKNADQGGRFIRFGTENKAYLASLTAWLDNDAKGWADASLLNLKTDDVAKLSLPLDDAGTVTLTRAKKDDPWRADPSPGGKTLKTDKVTSSLSSLASLRFSDSADPADGAAKAAHDHLRTYQLTTFAGKTYTVALGRKPEEKKLKPVTARKPDLSIKPGEKPAGDVKQLPAPEYDTIPAGPVYAWVTPLPSPAYGKRAFSVDEYVFTSLPQKSDDLFDTPPQPAKK